MPGSRVRVAHHAINIGEIEIMRRKILIIISILICSSLVLVIIFKPNFWYPANLTNPIDYFIWDFDYRKYHAMESIRVGMSEMTVKSILGEPDEISYESIITQYHGNRSEYGKNIVNPNKCYLYSTGIDILACIIFDKNNKVIYVNVGGT